MSSSAARRLGAIASHLASTPVTGSAESSDSSRDQASRLADMRRKYGHARPDGMQLRGMNHTAIVCADMERTLRFYGDVMGLRLVKTVELAGADGGQHFFFDIGQNECLAFFWFPEAPKAAPGIATVDPKLHTGEAEMTTAIGSIHHIAFNCDEAKLKEYRARLKKAGVHVSPMLYHIDAPEGFAPSRTDDCTWISFYFFGPDGEYLELTAQTTRPFTPENDITLLPKTDKEIKLL